MRTNRFNFASSTKTKLIIIMAVGFIFASVSAVIATKPKLGMVDAEEISFTFGAVGDHGRSSNTAGVIQGIGASQLDFFLSLGDLSYTDPTVFSEKQWCQFVKDNINIGAGQPIGSAYGENYPFEIIAGNHESNTYHNDGLIENFITPDCLPNRMAITESPLLGTNPSATGNYAKEYYIDYPTSTPLARFFMVDPGMNFTHGGKYVFTKGSERYNWLADSIDQARAQGIKWIVVSHHYNYISTGAKSDEQGIGDFFNLLVEKKVDLLLQGHDHNYQRSKQFAHSPGCPTVPTTAANMACIADSGEDGTFTKGNGMILLINGVGGFGSYAASTTDEHSPYFAKVNYGGGAGTIFGFTKFTVTENSFSASFMRTGGNLFADNFVIETSSVPSDTTPPSAPANLVATAPSSSRVDLSWEAATDDTAVTGYDIYRDGQRIVSGITNAQYADTTVSASTQYTYSVRARDAAGNVGADSNNSVITTPAPVQTTLTFTPTDDARISRQNGGSNFGNATTLLVDNSPVHHTLFKFTVSGTAGKSIQSARLRLYVQDGSNSGGALRRVNNTTWRESTVTWNNAPAQSSTVVSSVGVVTRGTWVEYNLASIVTQDGTYSFRLSSGSGDGADFSSTESATNRPQVVVTVQ